MPRRKTIDKITLQEQITIFADKHTLNNEEIELVTSMVEGKSNKEIALEQKLTLTTVKHRIYSIYRKCGISSRAELLSRLR